MSGRVRYRAMKNVEKQELARLVKRSIDYGYSMTDTVKKLSGLGFKQHTIRKYYKTFSREFKHMLKGGRNG